MYFISAAVIPLRYLALMVQVSPPYNRAGRASVFYNFIPVFFRSFCGLNTLFIILLFPKQKHEIFTVYTSVKPARLFDSCPGHKDVN
jgi:hypothetical protein